ncbi:hypothetical protein CF327_g7141 [Tilletia walkeri]|nr:hypothetical protein CF327_g7141 [Tilletia walkeri]
MCPGQQDEGRHGREDGKLSRIGAAEPRSARFGDGSGARATVQGPQDHGWGAASSQYAKTMIVKIQGPVLQHPQDNGDGAAAATLRRQNAAGYLKAKAKNRCGGTKVPDLQRKPRMLTIQGPEALRDKDWAGLLTLSSLSVFESQEAFLREAFEEDGARAKKEQEDAEKKEKARLRKENDRLKEENARLKEDSARLQEENTRLRKESTAAGKGKRKASDTGLGGVPSTSAGVEASTTPMRIGVPAEVTETEALATLSTPAFPSGVFLQIIQSRSSRRGLETARWIVIDYGGLTEQGEHTLGVKTKGKAREITAVISRCVKTRAQQRQDGPRSAEGLMGQGLSHYAKSRQPYCSERCFKTQDTADEREGRYRQRRPGQQERSVTNGSSRLTPLGRSGKTTVCGASETAEPLPHGQKEICSGGAMRSGR